MQLYIKSKQVNLITEAIHESTHFQCAKKLGCLENEELESKDPADIENWENEDPADIEDW